MRAVPPDPLAARSDDFTFLAPGLLHQFGNLFLTIHGNALVLDTEHVERAKTAIHGACERGGASLRVVRALLGENGSERACARATLRQMVELLRVPLREAGHGLDMVDTSGPAPVVDVGAFVPLVVRAVRALVATVPAGISGVVIAAIDAGSSGGSPGRLVLRFRPPAGTLPFPLPLDAVRRELLAEAQRLRWPGSIHTRSDGFDLGLAPVPAARDTAQA